MITKQINRFWKQLNSIIKTKPTKEFRNCVLSLLFLRILSENYEQYAKKELELKELTLKDWYLNNKDDINLFEKQAIRKLYYVINPNFLWKEIIKSNNNITNILTSAFKNIESKSLNNILNNLFLTTNLNSDILGKNQEKRNEKLISLVKVINSIDLTIDIAFYEKVINKFYINSDLKAGEFYTPQQLSTIISEIIKIDNPDIKNIFDPTCGTGSLLLNIRNDINKKLMIYGHENNLAIYNIARMNMLLNRVKPIEFNMYHGDSLKNKSLILQKSIPFKQIKFDAVVSVPPFDLGLDMKSLKKDFRFKDYKFVDKLSSANFAFLLHGFKFLEENGTMAIVLSTGTLSRGGFEQKIRAKLIKDGNIDTVINLPYNIFNTTGIQTCILILKKQKKKKNIFFIDASNNDNFKKDKIVEAYNNKRNIKGFSTKISLKEIKAKKYSLEINAYLK